MARPMLPQKKVKPISTGWIIVTAIIILLICTHFALKPVRSNLSSGYLTSGEKKLADKQYTAAIVDFKKSDWLVKGSAAEALSDSNSMQLDILAGEIYFRKYNKIETLEDLAQAKTIPSNLNDGLERVKKLIEADKTQEAEVAADILLEMDSNNSKVWAYLGIARLQSALLVPMTESNHQTKLLSAKEAFQKAVNLDKEDTISKKYLEQVDELLE